MNILFSGNDNVFDGILTCMLSVFKRTESKEPFTIYILTMDVSRIKPEYIAIKDEKIAFLEEVAKGYNPDNRVIKIDVTDIYEREFANSPNEQCYCSPYTLLRLFIDLIPQIPDKNHLHQLLHHIFLFPPFYFEDCNHFVHVCDREAGSFRDMTSATKASDNALKQNISHAKILF